MGRKRTTVMPSSRKALVQMGDNIRMARLRRKLSMSLVAERAGISLPTLRAIEQGSPSVSIGSHAAVLLAIGMKDELAKVAADDKLVRTLQDLAIATPKRAPKNKAKASHPIMGESASEAKRPRAPHDRQPSRAPNRPHCKLTE